MRVTSNSLRASPLIRVNSSPEIVPKAKGNNGKIPVSSIYSNSPSLSPRLPLRRNNTETMSESSSSPPRSSRSDSFSASPRETSQEPSISHQDASAPIPIAYTYNPLEERRAEKHPLYTRQSPVVARAVDSFFSHSREPLKKNLSVMVNGKKIKISTETALQSKFKGLFRDSTQIHLFDVSASALELADKMVKDGNYSAITSHNVIDLKEVAFSLGLKTLMKECNLFLCKQLSFLNLSPLALKSSGVAVKMLSSVASAIPEISPKTAFIINNFFEADDMSFLSESNIEELEEAARILEIPKLARCCKKYKEEQELFQSWERHLKTVVQ